MTDLWAPDAVTLAGMLRRREVSARDVIEAHVQRIEAVDGACASPTTTASAPQDRAALDEWRAGQIPGELELVNRFIRDVRQHGKWAKASRAGGFYTVEDLEALHDD